MLCCVKSQEGIDQHLLTTLDPDSMTRTLTVTAACSNHFHIAKSHFPLLHICSRFAGSECCRLHGCWGRLASNLQHERTQECSICLQFWPIIHDKVYAALDCMAKVARQGVVDMDDVMSRLTAGKHRSAVFMMSVLLPGV